MMRRVVGTVALLLLVIAIPVLLSSAGSTSSARFGASEAIGPNRLAAATLSIAPGAQTQEFVIAAMAPGDVTRGRLDIVNDGDLPLRYSLTSEGDDSTLAQALELTVWTARTCEERPPSARATLFRAAPLSEAEEVFGNRRPGDDPGDRTLDPRDQETLCYTIVLPLDAGNGLQGLTAAHTIVAYAEHDLVAQREVELNP